MSCLGRSRGYSLKQEVPSRTELAVVKVISVVLVELLPVSSIITAIN